jgi:preprotein translocase subunit SecD
VSATFWAENASADELQEAAQVMTARLETLGVDDPSVGVFESTIVVQLPPVDDTSHLWSLLAQPGYLELVDLSGVGSPIGFEGATIWTTGQAERFGSPPNEALSHPETGEPFETVIDGTAVTSAQPILDQFGQWTIQVTFSEAGAEALGSFTAAHIGDPLAIVIDGKVISAPIIQAQVSDQAVIAGNFTEQEARGLAVQIGSGPLPIRLELLSIS